ncbi:protein-glutamate O-methyltransferase CheR [Paenibacillus sp. J2TS4]|uniref:CheR family methyltransferase n=1 Tax=Paenibacillus sp. J2TS4 TaxID=2807194 RepID=UPI001BCED79F|nr:protein-glutamate O-methyltransferase CheR [Paenibacillus sp. J2TS4]
MNEDRERIEIELLLEGIYRLYGYDMRSYAYNSVRRRIWHRVQAMKLQTISALQEKVLHDPKSMKQLMKDMMINVTEMYRDPSLFLTFREKVVPLLHTYPFIRIWHAGCSTGEEVFSMAVLLHEEGLYHKSRIYATDVNEDIVDQAKTGTFPLRKMQKYTKNYMLAGGSGAFSQYYSATESTVTFHPFLKENIVFAQHNLVTDRSFNEFHVIFCRNVLIYFNKELQDHVHHLFYESLAPLGVLVLGNRESINFTRHADCYEMLNYKEKLYRKVK